MENCYCVDTSAWIDLKQLYPFEIFPSLWSKLDSLREANRLISPEQVYEELRKKDDEVFQWVRGRRTLFREIDEEQIILVQEILSVFLRLIDPQKETPDADPFVIALSVLETRNLRLLGGECIVVSQEKLGGGRRVKIPEVCSNFHYPVKHFSLIDFFKGENWRF